MSDCGADERLSRRLMTAAPRLAVLDPVDYQALNGDLVDVPPLTHFARHGAWESRRYVRPEKRTARLAIATRAAPRIQPLDAAAAARGWRAAADLTVRIQPSRGRRSEADAALAARRLSDVGARVHTMDPADHHRIPALCEVEIFMDAPAIFQGRRPEGADADRLGRATVWVCGAPGDSDFDAALPYALGAHGVICEASQSHAVFAHAGMRSMWFGAPPDDVIQEAGPPDHPLVAGLSRAVRTAPAGLPWSERPIEIAALEDATHVRSEAWRRLAGPLSTRALVVRRPAGPDRLLPNEAELRRFIYARSRVVLHLHADEQRSVPDEVAAEAAQAQAVLMSERSPPHCLLTPGVHYVEEDVRRMAAALDDLAEEPEAAAQMAGRLRRAMVAAFSPDHVGLQMALLLSGAPPR